MPNVENEIFLDALERTDSGERAAFLEEACGGDTEAREQPHPEVEELP